MPRLCDLRTRFAACAAAVLLLSGCSRAADVEVAAHRLANGLQVLVYADHSAPVVSIALWYRVGSRYEQAGKRGLAHLLEHMMFRGSKNIAPEEHARLIDAVGGVENAFTTADATVYWEKVPSDQLELVLGLEAERMHLLEITGDKLATELEVVKEEYRAALQNNPLGFVFERFQGVALAGTPYAWTPAGAVEDLDRLATIDLQAFYKAYYAPNNAVLVVAGDVRAVDAFRLAEGYFGPIPAADLPAPPPVGAPQPPGERLQTLSLPIQLPAILGGYLIPGADHRDLPALEVASLILSGGQSARLYRELVEDQRLAVYAVGAAESFQQLGLFLCLALFTPDKEARAVADALQQAVEGLAKRPPSEHELAKAKNQLTAQYVFGLDSLDGVANAIGGAAILLGDYRLFAAGARRYAAVTAADVERVAREYLRPENLVLVMATPGL